MQATPTVFILNADKLNCLHGGSAKVSRLVVMKN